MSKISMFWILRGGIKMPHVKWLVAPCWCAGQINNGVSVLLKTANTTVFSIPYVLLLLVLDLEIKARATKAETLPIMNITDEK